jgi:hypothetical protein
MNHRRATELREFSCLKRGVSILNFQKKNWSIFIFMVRIYFFRSVFPSVLVFRQFQNRCCGKKKLMEKTDGKTDEKIN